MLPGTDQTRKDFYLTALSMTHIIGYTGKQAVIYKEMERLIKTTVNVDGQRMSIVLDLFEGAARQEVFVSR